MTVYTLTENAPRENNASSFSRGWKCRYENDGPNSM